MNKFVRKIYMLIFVIIICVPMIIWFVFGDKMNSQNRENRELAQKKSTFMQPDEYEAYFNDNMPFRYSLINLNSNIDYYVFNKAPHSSVILGKDGWLFYNGPDGDPMDCYNGCNLFSDEELKRLADHWQKIRDKLETQGIEFVLYIVPNKERIYKEYMPSYYGQPADTYATQQLVQYLRENTDIRVVYPYDELMEAKDNLNGKLLYYKTDTHWNKIGGYIGARAMLEELGIYMPDITHKSINIKECEFDDGELMILLNMYGMDDVEYEVSGYETNNVELIGWDFKTLIQYTSQNADPRTIYICRDSFSSNMAAYIGSQFEKTYLVHRKSYTYEDLIEKDPDIFVYQLVERYVSSYLYFELEKTE